MEYITDSLAQLDKLNKVNNEVEASLFLLKLARRINEDCTLGEIEEACAARIAETSLLHSAKNELSKVTKALLRYEEQKIESILRLSNLG